DGLGIAAGATMEALGVWVNVWLVAIVATVAILFAAGGNLAAANGPDHAPQSADTIPPGTIITMQNWQNFRQFMPDGMAAMFEGKYFWKMPPDVQMEVGP